MNTVRTTLSVAMCTYNGERYLPEQLASIVNQTDLPDEVVVVDDNSSDSSTALVQQWAKSVPFPVHLHQNSSNLGSTKSFERALGLCTGDIITLTDQDDAWYPERLAASKAWLITHPEMDAVFSNADLIDDDSKAVGQQIWNIVGFTEEVRQQWQRGRGYEILLSSYVVTGATLTLRRSALAGLLPFPTHVQHLIHDTWISLVLALKGRIGFIEQALIRYRQHTTQQVGFQSGNPKVSLLDRFRRSRDERMAPILQSAHRYRQLYDLLSTRTDIDPQRLRRLKRMADHLTRRTTMPRTRLFRVPYVTNEFISGNYQLFRGHWWLTILGDLFEK